jgi:hypothetical protein
MFDPGSGQVGFVVDKVTLGKFFSEYFGVPCQSSFHQTITRVMYTKPKVAFVPSEASIDFSPSMRIHKKNVTS